MAEHGHDTTRCGQPNRWFGADTCECICGCSFIATGHYFNAPLCRDCAAEYARLTAGGDMDERTDG